MIASIAIGFMGFLVHLFLTSFSKESKPTIIPIVNDVIRIPHSSCSWNDVTNPIAGATVPTTPCKKSLPWSAVTCCRVP
jgi:hypothetical protein